MLLLLLVLSMWFCVCGGWCRTGGSAGWEDCKIGVSTLPACAAISPMSGKLSMTDMLLDTSEDTTEDNCPKAVSADWPDVWLGVLLSGNADFWEAMGGDIRGAGLFSDSRVSKPGMGKMTDTESLVLMLSLLLLLVMVVTSESDTLLTPALDTLQLPPLALPAAAAAAAAAALLDFLSLFLLLALAGLGVFRESEDLLCGVTGSKASRVLVDDAMAADVVMFMVEDKIAEGGTLVEALLLLPFLLFDLDVSCFAAAVVGGLSS